MATVLANPKNRLKERLIGGVEDISQRLLTKKLEKQKREQELQDAIDKAAAGSVFEGKAILDPNSPLARRLGERGIDLSGITPREDMGKQLGGVIDYTTLLKNLSELGISPAGMPQVGQGISPAMLSIAPTAGQAPTLGQPRPMPELRATKYKQTPFGGPMPSEYEAIPTEEERRLKAQEKLEQSPFYQEGRAKRAQELIESTNLNEVKKQMIAQATKSLEKIPTGLGGKMKMWWSKMFDPENPVMEDWQKVKMVLTDAQLMNTAKTKGAISDQEMKLFSKAAANDDIASVRAMRPVFDKLVKFIDSEQAAKSKTYQFLYNENPAQFNGQPTGQPETDLPSEDDIQYTMRKHGLTREEVLQRMGQ